jgi:hypothetical protein
MEGLKHIAAMSGLAPSRLQSLVAEKLWEMCFHFVGPDDVPMKETDVKLVLEATDGLDSLALFNASIGRAITFLDDITANARNLFEIGMWYGKPRIGAKVIELHRTALDGCYDDDVVGFRQGREALRRSLGELRKFLQEQRPGWKAQAAAIEEILAADDARAGQESAPASA